MLHANFECLNLENNVLRFFNLEIDGDFFAEFRLIRCWGRIGSQRNEEVLSSGTFEAMIDELVSHSMDRIRHGYSLTEHNLPYQHLDRILQFQELNCGRSRDRLNRRSKVAQASAALGLSKAFGAGLSQTKAIEAFLNNYDPCRTRTNKNTQRSAATSSSTTGTTRFSFCEDKLKEADINFDLERSKVIRDLFRHLAISLLQEDPLARHAVLRAVSLPHLDNTDLRNVTQIVSFKDGLIRRSIGDLFFDFSINSRGEDRETGKLLSLDLEERLENNGIRSVGDLLKIDLSALLREELVSRRELRAIAFALARHGVMLDASYPSLGSVGR